MIKGYVRHYKAIDKPDRRDVEIELTSNPQLGAYWGTLEEADRDCRSYNSWRIRITSASGDEHTCTGFKSEQRRPGEFVVFCEVPFIRE
jgi:hypothetical protein